MKITLFHVQSTHPQIGCLFGAANENSFPECGYCCRFFFWCCCVSPLCTTGQGYLPPFICAQESEEEASCISNKHDDETKWVPEKHLCGVRPEGARNYRAGGFVSALRVSLMISIGVGAQVCSLMVNAHSLSLHFSEESLRHSVFGVLSYSLMVQLLLETTAQYMRYKGGYFTGHTPIPSTSQGVTCWLIPAVTTFCTDVLQIYSYCVCAFRQVAP